MAKWSNIRTTIIMMVNSHIMVLNQLFFFLLVGFYLGPFNLERLRLVRGSALVEKHSIIVFC